MERLSSRAHTAGEAVGMAQPQVAMHLLPALPTTVQDRRLWPEMRPRPG